MRLTKAPNIARETRAKFPFRWRSNTISGRRRGRRSSCRALAISFDSSLFFTTPFHPLLTLHHPPPQFALIPHDTSKPIRSVFLPPQPTAGDNLPNFCKPYFADSNSVDVNLLNQQATKQFSSGQLSGMDPSNISASAMNKVAAQGSVETFPLVHPGSTNKYCGVYIYLDEVGMLKKLPPNLRASQIATR